MSFEATFCRKPNVGNKKRFTTLDNKQREVNVEVEGFEMNETADEQEATTSKGATSKAHVESASASDSEEEAPISMVATRRQRQAEALQTREELNDNKVKNGERMVKKHDHKKNKKTTVYQVGDQVTIRIPTIDRAATNFKRLPGVVAALKSYNGQMHRILTEYGVLNDWYGADDLEKLLAGHIDVNLDDFKKHPDDVPTISLTSAAALQASNTGSLEAVKTMCNCFAGCSQDKRCKCFRLGLKCTSHCHGKLNTNKTKLKKPCTNR